jgi:hypothetical protein
VPTSSLKARRARRPACALLIAAGVAACSTGAVVERLDERAGMTLVSAREALVFARTDPRYSRSARDYLYVGPLETNRQGVREHYLWVGVASTLDRGFVAPAAEPPQTLYVTVEGEPIELTLRPLGELVRRTIDAPLYATAVPLRAELAARVTLQQLELLDSAALESIAVSAGEGQPRTYVRWEETASFADFLTTVRRQPRDVPSPSGHGAAAE